MTIQSEDVLVDRITVLVDNMQMLIKTDNPDKWGVEDVDLKGVYGQRATFTTQIVEWLNSNIDDLHGGVGESGDEFAFVPRATIEVDSTLTEPTIEIKPVADYSSEKIPEGEPNAGCYANWIDITIKIPKYKLAAK